MSLCVIPWFWTSLQEEIVGRRQKEGAPPCVVQGQNSHCTSCSLVAPAEECPIPTLVFQQQPVQIHNTATVVLRHSQQALQKLHLQQRNTAAIVPTTSDLPALFALSQRKQE